jgi:hypothetical protein
MNAELNAPSGLAPRTTSAGTPKENRSATNLPHVPRGDPSGSGEENGGPAFGPDLLE